MESHRQHMDKTSNRFFQVHTGTMRIWGGKGDIVCTDIFAHKNAKGTHKEHKNGYFIIFGHLCNISH
ncbi:hypothetical protein D3C76_1631050 [compost metagenome]